ncbi:hypothetical protein [Corynebacterium sp. HMSC05E07]|uniref:hypothetical protein n=1 Tax=Corynebacterium sp. HMSC05E07 TaxID=1581117 RepID=UPI0008A25FC3|nr:hypothetical protein [Corynebacterium sp. HMSC05E07]OFT59860.1 hypothetical protein HMPREF3149_09240 [Corynebacterium sp. HMSC05E07]
MTTTTNPNELILITTAEELDNLPDDAVINVDLDTITRAGEDLWIGVDRSYTTEELFACGEVYRIDHTPDWKEFQEYLHDAEEMEREQREEEEERHRREVAEWTQQDARGW